MTPYYEQDNITLFHGDCREVLRQLPDESVDCCVTSPPYFGLRDYGTAKWDGGDDGCDHEPPQDWIDRLFNAKSAFGNGASTQSASAKTRWYKADGSCPKCGARRIDSQIGLEQTPEAYVAELVAVFREVRRVLKDDGTLWLNLGDSYAGSGKGAGNYELSEKQKTNVGANYLTGQSARDNAVSKLAGQDRQFSLKPKDLIGIPWQVAFALRADGWYLRQDIIWCLSGGTWIYARTQKGDMPMMLRDAARLDPRTVKLWNGEKWTQVLGWSRTSRNADELELVLRSGERIACTPTHQFPTSRGLLKADEIQVGDCLKRVQLPEPESPKDPFHIGKDAAWFAGLYLAEGSMSGNTIQLAGHSTQTDRLDRVKAIANSYGASVTCTTNGNCQAIRVYGRVLVAIVKELVTGSVAKDKAIAPVCWRYSNLFLREMLEGYLSGDGYYDAGNDRWRLGFTRNYNLERDLRTLAARLGLKLTLNMVFVEGFGQRWPAFKGEIRFKTSGHHNERSGCEVVEIRRSRCREVYDVGVEDEPHLFALASGILTHNSKPNPMPESVTDRCTKAHEYIFLLAKGQWRSRIVELSNLNGERVHLSQNIGLESPDSGAIAISVGIASAILNCPKLQQQFGLATFDPKIWQERLSNLAGDDICRMPIKHRATVLASRFLNSDCSAKELLAEINRLGITLTKGNNFLIGGIDTEFALPPSVNSYGKTSIAIHNSGKICEFDFVHGCIITRYPSGCNYWYDADAIAEPAIYSGITGMDGSGFKDPCSFNGKHATAKMFGARNAIEGDDDGKRNRRSVWTVPTHSFPAAHFATFPPKLIEPCIKAGCRVGGVVLDPFNGAGTTGLVAMNLNCKYIGIELNQDYLDMTASRLSQGVLAFEGGASTSIA